MISESGRYSLPLGTYLDIPVYGHWSLLIPYGAVSLTLLQGFGPFFVAFCSITALYLSVILHEYGHSIVAKRYGFKVGQIHMTMIGGIAGLQLMERGEMSEFWISIAGPAVNVIIAGLIYVGFIIVGVAPVEAVVGAVNNLYIGEGVEFFPPWQYQFWALVGAWNLVIPAFNLLPTFPMDGGRIFRSLLTQKFGLVPATKIAVAFGVIFGVVFAGYGGWNLNPVHFLLGGFVAALAINEYYEVVKNGAGRSPKNPSDTWENPLRDIELYKDGDEASKLIFISRIFASNYQNDRREARYGSAWGDMGTLNKAFDELENKAHLSSSTKTQLNMVCHRQTAANPDVATEKQLFSV